MRKINIGLVGAGYIANKTHLPILTSNSGVRIVAICDSNRNIAEKTAKDYAINSVYDNFTKMLKDESLDAVDILTPPPTHALLAVEALENGCHVLLEKPLATKKEDADRLIRLAYERKRFLNVIHNWSFTPCFRRTRAIMESGLLGEIVNVDLRFMGSIEFERYNRRDHWIHSIEGGAFSDIAPHLVMLLLDFLGQFEVIDVKVKKTSDVQYLKADQLNVLVSSQKALGSFTLSLNTPGFMCYAAIYGTKASLFVDADTNSIVKYLSPKSSDHYLSRRAKVQRALSDITQRTKELTYNVTSVAFGRGMPSSSKYLIDAFVNNINGKRTYPIMVEKARDVVSLLEEIYKCIPQ